MRNLSRAQNNLSRSAVGEQLHASMVSAREAASRRPNLITCDFATCAHTIIRMGRYFTCSQNKEIHTVPKSTDHRTPYHCINRTVSILTFDNRVVV